MSTDNISGTWVTFERTFNSRPTIDELNDFTAGLPVGAKVQFSDSTGLTGLGGLTGATHVRVRYQIADDLITDAPEARP